MERKKRRTYDAEFKKDAIALSNEPDKTISGVERSLGIPFGIISHWKKKVLLEGHLAFPGKGIEALTEDQKRIKELEKALKDAQLERDILKKAVGIFSKAPQ